ncbi:CIC11C00000000512 [Sungouiella intermedia]|uniref:Magnesium transporter n=1 Tax=Sungouiella intermedia TaxID=45354 RepID=A0A1L0D848_9ASCO|nr:CIC11C00000000512 [[Candida] intermedia]
MLPAFNFSQVLRRAWRPSVRHFSRSCEVHQDYFNDVFVNNTLKHAKSLPDNEYVRCTVYDKNGDMVVHGKNIRKLEFMKTYDLAPRDLRKMVRSHISTGTPSGVFVEFVPLLATRKNSILLNLLNIRAIIKCDSLVVFDNYSSLGLGSRFNESHSHGVFLKEMSTRLKASHPEANTLPYEFRALEGILVDVTTNLNTEMSVHKKVLSNILSSLDDSIERTKLRYLLIQSKKLGQFRQKAQLIKDLLDYLLNEDDELNAMYLTEILQGQQRHSFNHQEVELLLESYYATIDEIIQTVDNLISQIKTSEEIIRFVLDSNRNDLMLLGLRFSIGLLSMGLTMYIAALYGMNLENFIEEKDGGLELIVGVASVSMMILFIYCTRQIKSLQRFTLSSASKEKAMAARTRNIV